MASINDVAKLAGVSITTVSKVINGYTDVSSKTRQKVLNIITEMKFQPNVIARSLVKGRSWAVGIFLTTTFANSFVSGVMGGMKKILENSGYDLIYLAQGNKDPDYNFVKHCLSRNVDGVVVFGFSRDDKNLEELIHAEIPTIFIDIDLIGKRAGYITSDNLLGTFLATEHLCRLGHRRIGYISPELGYFVARARFEGYKQGLSKNNVAFIPDLAQLYNDSTFSQQSGYEMMQYLLSLPEVPTAVVCASDNQAIGAYRAIRERGLTIPDDMSIIGYDDSESCEILYPALTSVRQKIATIGEKTIETLIYMIEDPLYSPNEIIIPTELIVRGSCGHKLMQDNELSL